MEEQDEVRVNDAREEPKPSELTTLVAAERAIKGINEMERLLPHLDELTTEDQTKQVKSFNEFIGPINKAIAETRRPGNRYPLGHRLKMTRNYMDAILKHQDVWLQIVEKIGIKQVNLVVDLMCGHGLRVREQVDTISIQRFIDQMLRHLMAFRQRMFVLRKEIESDSLLDEADRLESYDEIIRMKDSEKARIGRVMEEYGRSSKLLLEKEGAR